MYDFVDYEDGTGFAGRYFTDGFAYNRGTSFRIDKDGQLWHLDQDSIELGPNGHWVKYQFSGFLRLYDHTSCRSKHICYELDLIDGKVIKSEALHCVSNEVQKYATCRVCDQRKVSHDMAIISFHGRRGGRGLCKDCFYLERNVNSGSVCVACNGSSSLINSYGLCSDCSKLQNSISIGD